MSKPVSMLQSELNVNISTLINESLQQMPAFVVRPIVENVLRQIVQIEEKQLQMDKETWEKECKENALKEEKGVEDADRDIQ